MLLCLHKTIIQLLLQQILAPKLQRSEGSFIKPDLSPDLILNSYLILKSMDLILRRNKLRSMKAETVMAIFLYVQVKSMYNDLTADLIF